MYILGIETTGPYLSVALIKSEGEIFETLAFSRGEDRLTHLMELIPRIKQCLKEAGITKEEISYIAVSAGPGSFTGIRIGVSTARALGQTLNIPIIPVSGLMAFSEKNHEKNIKLVLFNARRGQVYAYMEEFIEEGPYLLEEVMGKIASEISEIRTKKLKIQIFGDGIDAYENEIKVCFEKMGFTDYETVSGADRYQDAKTVAIKGLKELKQGREPLLYFQVKPNYMREAEAEMRLKAGQLPICKGPKQE